MKKINRPETLLKLNAFRVHENNNTCNISRINNLSSIDYLIRSVKNKECNDEYILDAICYYGYFSVDMPKYYEE